MTLNSFPDKMRVALFGASGGIGRALLDALIQSPRVAQVHAFSRQALAVTDKKMLARQVDITQEAQIAAAADACRGLDGLHLVIVATGMLHTPEIQPEKTWRTLSASALLDNYAVNAVGPALIAKHFLDLLVVREKSVFAALSARVGSIEDNHLGGWHSYRAAKAGLHQIIRTCSIELARRNPAAICVALHPGTVNTALSKPFQGAVSDGKLFAPAYAAECLLQVVDSLTPASTGRAFAWDGQAIPF
jgi:NAD(P)-dependent dehydrogenase (short-subunit alcohol dehydrogenase family)